MNSGMTADELADFALEFRRWGQQRLDWQNRQAPEAGGRYMPAGVKHKRGTEKYSDKGDDDDDDDDDDEDDDDDDELPPPPPSKKLKKQLLEFRLMPPEMRAYIMQFLLYPRFPRADDAIAVGVEQAVAPEEEGGPETTRRSVVYNHLTMVDTKELAIKELRRLLTAYDAARLGDRVLRDELMHPQLRVALYKNWFLAPTPSLPLEVPTEEGGGDRAKKTVEEGYYAGPKFSANHPDYIVLTRTVPELNAATPMRTDWYSTFLANVFLHWFLTRQSRDQARLSYAHEVLRKKDKVYWNGKRRTLEEIQAYWAWPGSVQVGRPRSWELIERTTGKSLSTEKAHVTKALSLKLPGYNGVLVIPEVDGPFQKARWMMSDTLEQPQMFMPPKKEFAPYPVIDSFARMAHKSLAAATIIRVPTILMPFRNQMNWWALEKNVQKARFWIQFARHRRVVVWDPPLATPKLPAIPQLGYSYGMGWNFPPAAVYINNVSLGSARNAARALSRCLYLNAPTWVAIELINVRESAFVLGENVRSRFIYDLDAVLFRGGTRIPRNAYHGIIHTVDLETTNPETDEAGYKPIPLTVYARKRDKEQLPEYLRVLERASMVSSDPPPQFSRISKIRFINLPAQAKGTKG